MTALSFDQHYSEGSFAPFVRERRASGQLPVTLFELAQPAGDFSDPPVGDLVIHIALTTHRLSARIGDARFDGVQASNHFGVVAPYMPTEIILGDANVFRVLCIPQPRALQVLSELRPNRDPFDFGQLCRGDHFNRFILELIERLWTAVGCGQSALYIDAMIVALLGEITRTCEHPTSKPARGGLAPWQVRRVCDYMDSHLAEDLALLQLAALIGVSIEHFCRAFKESTGLAPHRWLIVRRMEQARLLLDTTKMLVGDISAQVGYNEPSHFARTFRKAYGLTPSNYRRTL